MNKPRIDQGPDYERGFIDGMQYQMQSSVDKAVNAMAQPEQEPVAFLTNRRQRLTVEFNATGFTLMPKSVDWKIPIYTTPPQRTWVGLTDEEYTEMWGKKPDLLNFFRQIEAKLKEKNT